MIVYQHSVEETVTVSSKCLIHPYHLSFPLATLVWPRTNHNIVLRLSLTSVLFVLVLNGVSFTHEKKVENEKIRAATTITALVALLFASCDVEIRSAIPDGTNLGNEKNAYLKSSFFSGQSVLCMRRRV